MDDSKQHGNTGNQNAKKPPEERRSSTLYVRCLHEEKVAWTRAAKAENMKLAEWVTARLNSAVEKDI